MNVPDLTKEQKQYAILGAAGIVVVVVLILISVKFSRTSISSAKQELDDLTGKIERAERALAKRDRVNEDLGQTVSVLKAHLGNVPPEKNYYSWATEIVYEKGSVAGLEIISVDELRPARAKKKGKAKSAIQFESYSLRINARGGYEQIKRFIGDLAVDQPLVRFVGLEISAGNDPEEHNVQFFLQWPLHLAKISKAWEGFDLKIPAGAQVAASKPAPVVGDVAPRSSPEVKPAPKSGVIPAVEAPEPVAVVVAPRPKPVPVVKPKPVAVVAAPRPKPVPVVKPLPVVVVKKPAAVEVVVAPKPKPVSVVKPVPKPIRVEPIPVVVAVTDPEPVLVVQAEEEEFGTIPPSLDSPREEKVAPIPTDEEVLASAELEAYMQKLAEESSEEKQGTPAETVEPYPASAEDLPVKYVSSSKSAKKLEELLRKGKPENNATLGSFLDDLVEDIND